MSPLTPDHVLLGLLLLQAAHGYDLLAHFRDDHQLGQVWHLSTSQLYAVLKRLESQGLIEGQTVTVPDAPPRTEYCLTPKGEAQFEAWLYTEHPPVAIRPLRVEFLSRLYLARLLNRPTLPLLQLQRAACHRRLAELTLKRNQLAGGIGFLAVEFMIVQLQSVLQWLDRCELRPLDSFDTEEV